MTYHRLRRLKSGVSKIFKQTFTLDKVALQDRENVLQVVLLRIKEKKPKQI